MALIKLLAPYRLYLMAAVALLLVFCGWKIRDWQCDAANAKAIQQSTKIKDKQSAVVNDVSREYEDKRSDANVTNNERANTIREIYRDIPAPPADCAAPDATRRLLEDGIRDANAAATGKPSVVVPSSGNAS